MWHQAPCEISTTPRIPWTKLDPFFLHWSCSHWLVTASQGRATATGKWFKLAPRWFLDKNKLTDMFLSTGQLKSSRLVKPFGMTIDWVDAYINPPVQSRSNRYNGTMLLHQRSQVLKVFEWVPVLFSSTSSLSNVHVNEAWVRRLHSDLEPWPSTVSEWVTVLKYFTLFHYLTSWKFYH